MSKNILSTFLHKLADDIDSEYLTPEELQQISEFYISWSFKNRNPDEEEDFLKFFTLGWYVYNQLKSN